MLNLIVLCHYCFGWVEPVSNRCSECGVGIDLDQPDPDRSNVAQLIGEPTTVVGPVRIERRAMPSFGHLIVTTGGLLFLPRLHRKLNGALEATTSERSPAWWPFQSDQSPSKFLAWLRRSNVESATGGDTASSEQEQDTEPLVDRLIESPGAFFIARSTIRSRVARRRWIQINRQPIRSVIINDETDDGSMLAAINSLLEENSES